jgi:hypothetical protein
MPLFRFEFHEKTNDITVELVDHEAALAEAKRAAGECWSIVPSIPPNGSSEFTTILAS